MLMTPHPQSTQIRTGLKDPGTVMLVDTEQKWKTPRVSFLTLENSLKMIDCLIVWIKDLQSCQKAFILKLYLLKELNV